ncbi:MAG: hypothetical protein PHN89_02910 [Candidatus Pacebacteria bacterium]|nr:hypothetical protein [Candidatus Paceibacterota bacterium]
MRVPAYVNPHSHLRHGHAVIRDLVMNVIRGGADTILAMPNIGDGLVTIQETLDYNRELNAPSVVGANLIKFILCMMLTENTALDEIDWAVKSGIRNGKVYPKDRTTKSKNGVRDYSRILPVVKRCGEKGMIVHLHPEHPMLDIGNRDAEYLFIPIVDMLMRETNAVIVWEHGTDARCIRYWKEWAKTGRFYVTLCPHHLVTNEDNTFGDVRATCKPPIKTEDDRLALLALIAENHPWVMAGPDDAPHPMEPTTPGEGAKHVHEGKCACGAYHGRFVYQLYAHALDPVLHLKTKHGRKVFVNFMSGNARKLHKLPPATREVTLVREPFKIPPFYEVGHWKVEPFWAGQTINWSIRE